MRSAAKRRTCDALRPLGAKPTIAMPITPDRVLEALGRERSSYAARAAVRTFLEMVLGVADGAQLVLRNGTLPPPRPATSPVHLRNATLLPQVRAQGGVRFAKRDFAAAVPPDRADFVLRNGAMPSQRSGSHRVRFVKCNSAATVSRVRALSSFCEK
jgi:hypothetical protein